MASEIKVSVLMVTYNHERFIRQAVESVLAQQTDFNYELIIGEDCSVDGTRGTLLELEQMHRDRIRLILNDKNVGGSSNFARLYSESDAEYVATLDGDDYWTCSHKLQRQVDFLEQNRSCSMCGHAVEFVDENGKSLNEIFPPYAERFIDLASFLDSIPVHESTPLLRRSLLPTLPPSYTTLRMGSIGHYALQLQFGLLGYIEDVMSAYRVQPGGVWTGASTLERARELTRTWEWLRENIGSSQRKLVERRLARNHIGLAYQYRKARQYRAALNSGIRALGFVRSTGTLLEMAKLPAQWVLDEFRGRSGEPDDDNREFR